MESLTFNNIIILFFHYLKQFLQCFEGLGQLKKSSDLKPTKSCLAVQPAGIDILPRCLKKLKQQSVATVFNYQEK